MRRIPWRLAVRVNRKGLVTVVGIALGVTFALVSYSIASGLERDTLGIARNHPVTAVAIASSDGAPLSWDELQAHEGVVGIVHASVLDAEGRAFPAMALRGATDAVGPGTARAKAPASFPLTLGDRQLAPNATSEHPFLPNGWVLVAIEDLPEVGARVDHALLLEPTEEAVAALAAQGLEAQRVPGLERFFSASGTEVARGLLLVMLFASALSVLFCYEFLRSEVRESRREIGIWRALGMRAGHVVALFLARAAALGAAAVWLGWGLAMLSLTFAHDRVGLEILRFSLGPGAATALSLAFIVATLLGGLLPAIAASRITVQRSMESEA